MGLVVRVNKKMNKNNQIKNTKNGTQKKQGGRLIVIEGGDGSGKGTQSELLVKKLREAGQHVELMDFPQYGEVFGALCGRALKGEFGDFKNLSPYLASLPYTLDRVTAKDKMLEALKRGHVICNRYTPSNVAYQAAKLAGKKRVEFIEFLERAEYEVLGLPKPDAVVYLRVPAAVAQKLILTKAKREYLGGKAKKDQHEKDVAYQIAVMKVYVELSKQRPSWKVIECVKAGRMQSIEEVGNMVMEVLKVL